MIRNWIRRFVAWLHRRLSRDQFEEVREFIYLDEISVRSLLASTGEGGIPTESVEQDVRTTRTMGGGGAGLSTGVANFDVKGGREREVQMSVEERRNYDLTQSKFTRLHNSDTVQTKLELSQTKNDTDAREFSGLPSGDLERGDIIEVRVDISAHLLFRLYQILDYFGDAIEDELDQEAKENLRLIELSLGNSIPIEGTAIDYCVVEENGQKAIELASAAKDQDADQVYELKIMTLLNVDDLWVDPIHTLFNDNEFLIYCRVEDVDLDVWHPLKVTRALGSLSPEAADDLNNEIMTELEAMRKQLSGMKALEDFSVDAMSVLAQDIAEYSDRLENEYDITVTEDEYGQLVRGAHRLAETSHQVSPTARRKEILNAFTDCFEEMFDLDAIEPGERQMLRPETKDIGGNGRESLSEEQEEVFRIEAKTVAVYW